MAHVCKYRKVHTEIEGKTKKRWLCSCRKERPKFRKVQ